ncbi:hypothetical protein [Rhodopila sp.]|uniref:hypothetical protein n=1 Tax=Rhodopila sp. TaxID=2480087 RepID=UPI003D14B129
MASRMSTHQTLLSLKTERDRLESKLKDKRSEIDSLDGELRGINRAIAILKGLEHAPAPIEQRRGRGSVKDVVLGLIGEHPDGGLKTVDVVDLAKARGVDLDRNSVASLLSRLARDGILAYDKDTRQYSLPPRPEPTPLRSVA